MLFCETQTPGWYGDAHFKPYKYAPSFHQSIILPIYICIYPMTHTIMIYLYVVLGSFTRAVQ